MSNYQTLTTQQKKKYLRTRINNRKSAKILKTLKPPEVLYVKNYLNNGFNKTAAAISAGYSKKTASVLAVTIHKRERVQNYIRQRIMEIADKLDVNFEDKIKLLWKTAKRCYGVTDEDLERLKSGENIENIFDFNPESLIKAIAELNKMQGHYAQEKKSDEESDLQKSNELINQYEKEC